MDPLAEITRPLQLYAWGYDGNDMEMLAACFTADAELLIAADGPDGETGVSERTAGREAILARFRVSRAGFAARGQAPAHLISDILIERAGEREADVRCRYLLCVQSPARLEIRRLGRYVDRLVNDGTAWRISRRVVIAPSEPSPGAP